MDIGTTEWWEQVRRWYFQRDEGLCSLRKGDKERAAILFEKALAAAPPGAHRSLSLIDSAIMRESHGSPEEAEQLMREAFAESCTGHFYQSRQDVMDKCSHFLAQNNYSELEQLCRSVIDSWERRRQEGVILVGSREVDFPLVPIFRLLAIFARRKSSYADAERWENEANSIELGTISPGGGYAQ